MESSHFSTGHHKTPPRKKENNSNGDQEGCRHIQHKQLLCLESSEETKTEKNADSVNTTGMSELKKDVLCPAPPNGCSAEHPIWRLKEEKRDRLTIPAKAYLTCMHDSGCIMHSLAGCYPNHVMIGCKVYKKKAA